MKEDKKYYSVIVKIYRNVSRVVADFGRVVWAKEKPKTYRRHEKEYEGIVKWFESEEDALKLIMNYV